MAVRDNIPSVGGGEVQILNDSSTKTLGAYSPSSNYTGSNNMTYTCPSNGTIFPYVDIHFSGASGTPTGSAYINKNGTAIISQSFSGTTDYYVHIIGGLEVDAGDVIEIMSSCTTLSGKWTIGGSTVGYNFITDDVDVVSSDLIDEWVYSGGITKTYTVPGKTKILVTYDSEAFVFPYIDISLQRYQISNYTKSFGTAQSGINVTKNADDITIVLPSNSALNGKTIKVYAM